MKRFYFYYPNVFLNQESTLPQPRGLVLVSGAGEPFPQLRAGGTDGFVWQKVSSLTLASCSSRLPISPAATKSINAGRHQAKWPGVLGWRSQGCNRFILDDNSLEMPLWNKESPG